MVVVGARLDVAVPWVVVVPRVRLPAAGRIQAVWPEVGEYAGGGRGPLAPPWRQRRRRLAAVVTGSRLTELTFRAAVLRLVLLLFALSITSPPFKESADAPPALVPSHRLVRRLQIMAVLHLAVQAADGPAYGELRALHLKDGTVGEARVLGQVVEVGPVPYQHGWRAGTAAPAAGSQSSHS